MSSLPFTLTIPSDLRMLSVARAFIEAICQTEDMDRNTIHNIVLAMGEAVTNIIRHGHREKPEASVQISCRIDSDAVEILLLDEADPFDLAAVPYMDPGELRVGGRGVYLMRALMDELSCQPLGARGNALRMVKRWRSSASVRDCG
ncbi:MAG TPA: ATP-binding protein [Gemmataceae bacterium]|nr:ATP-binding protein [Gemmataceae bacterium]